MKVEIDSNTNSMHLTMNANILPIEPNVNFEGYMTMNTQTDEENLDEILNESKVEVTPLTEEELAELRTLLEKEFDCKCNDLTNQAQNECKENSNSKVKLLAKATLGVVAITAIGFGVYKYMNKAE